MQAKHKDDEDEQIIDKINFRSHKLIQKMSNNYQIIHSNIPNNE